MKTWHRVKAPTVWRPEPGEELIGTYIATELKHGQYGEYLIHHIKTRNKIVYASGCVLDSLFALLQPDTKVKLVFTGIKVTNTERTVKMYELYTEEAIELKIAV